MGGGEGGGMGGGEDGGVGDGGGGGGGMGGGGVGDGGGGGGEGGGGGGEDGGVGDGMGGGKGTTEYQAAPVPGKRSATVRDYFRNLYLWLRGIRWLWTRRSALSVAGTNPALEAKWIYYKPGWTPLKFLPVYLTTYLAGTLLGYGVVSLSRAWYDRREKSRFAHVMTRLLNWIEYHWRRVFNLPKQREHGAVAGGRLWGSVNLRDN